ncbi:hypothetical protein APX77_000989 [Escherichia coli]|nr:hypothetical protein [Escherichia coli]EFK8659007.1 hypothetical protein [Escherichia coli]
MAKISGVVFPAPAGINRLAAAAPTSEYGVPRASGDKPQIAQRPDILP